MRIKVFLALGILVLVALLGLAGCSTASQAADNATPVKVNVNAEDGIHVNGEGKVSITPDIANLSLGVSAQASSVVEAQTQASTAMDKVMQALKDAGIDQKDIQTQYFNVQQMNRWDDKTQQEVSTGYMVSNMVVAKIRAISKVGDIIDAVVNAGGNYIRINGINFSVEKPEQYYAQAREAAMKDAKARAEDLAKLANVALGKATSIVEYSSSQPYYNYPMMRESMGGAVPAMTVAAPYISAGETQITLSVQIIYAIE